MQTLMKTCARAGIEHGVIEDPTYPMNHPAETAYLVPNAKIVGKSETGLAPITMPMETCAWFFVHTENQFNTIQKHLDQNNIRLMR
jgi:hypothetical protein